jgi:hypothetical protein
MRNTLIATLLVAGSAVTPAAPREVPVANEVLEQIRSHEDRQTEENAFWTRGYPDELKQRLSRELRERYHKLQQGEMFVIP